MTGADTRLPSTRRAVGRSTGAAPPGLPVRRPPPPFRHGDRHRRDRERRVHADHDALLPGRRSWGSPRWASHCPRCRVGSCRWPPRPWPTPGPRSRW